MATKKLPIAESIQRSRDRAKEELERTSGGKPWEDIVDDVRQAGSLEEMLAATKVEGPPRNTRYPVRWRTSKGQVLNLEEMKDSHLVATIFFLRRQAKEKQLSEARKLELLGRTVESQQLLAGDMREWFYNRHKKYKHMVAEAIRRDIALDADRDWGDGILTRSDPYKAVSSLPATHPHRPSTGSRQPAAPANNPSKRRIKL